MNTETTGEITKYSATSMAALALLGFSAGLAGASLGIGGGVIMVPVLTLSFHLPIKKAVGTSLATIIPSALVGTITYYITDPQKILFSTAALVVVGSIAGAYIGAWLSGKIHAKWLAKLFAVFMIIAALKILNIIKLPTENLAQGFWPLLIAVGLVTGLSSALFGIGGGVIMVPALTLFFVDNIHYAIPTSLAVIIPTSLAGAVFHRKLANIQISALKLMIPGALCGAVLGAILKTHLPAEYLRFAFGILIGICSFRLFKVKN